MDVDRIKGAARTSYGRLQEDYGLRAGDAAAAARGAEAQLRGRTEEFYGQAKDSVREAVDRASSYAETAYDEGRRQVERGADALNARVEVNPVMSILIACAVGYVLGLAMRTRRG